MFTSVMTEYDSRGRQSVYIVKKKRRLEARTNKSVLNMRPIQNTGVNYVILLAFGT